MAEVTVRGAGIFGLSIAWLCHQRGATVRIIDPNGVASGSSGGIVGALAPHVPENWNPKKQFQFESLMMAESFWRQVAQHSDTDPGYARLGRLQPLPPGDHDLAKTRGENAKTLWNGHAQWTIGDDLESAWLREGGPYIFDTLSARIHPRKACHALAEALAVAGIPVRPDGADQGRVVWATGYAGLEALSRDLDQTVGNGVKGQAALLDLDMQDHPQIFVDGIHIVPHADGTVAVGSTSERAFENPASVDQQLDDVVARARRAVPTLAQATILERWAGVRPRANSRAPMLGAWPGRSGHFIANGGFKIGFGMAPKIAEVMADLVLADVDTIPEGFEVTASIRT